MQGMYPHWCGRDLRYGRALRKLRPSHERIVTQECVQEGTGAVWKVLVRYANYFVKGKRRDVFVY